MSPIHVEHRVPLSQVSDLIAPDRPLPFGVLDDIGRLLLAEGQRIDGPRQLAALLERGACVEYADIEEVRRLRAAGATATASLVPSAVRQRNLFDRWEDELWALDELLRGLCRHAVQAQAVEDFADGHVALIDRDADVALYLAVRQDSKRFALYSVSHALNTATAVALSARLLGWPAAQVRQAVLGALTMNVSIIELQARMAEQADPPTKKQLDQIRVHPTESAALLRASGAVDAGWLQAVEDHHERAVGGYPRGVAEVGDLAHLLRVCDVFMAKISPRTLRAPMLPQLAAHQLFQDEGRGPFAAALIHALGIYPPGDFVRLKSGELAIIVRRARDGQGPWAVALRDMRGREVTGLSLRDTSQPEFGIAGPVPERAGLMRVPPEQVYGVLMP